MNNQQLAFIAFTVVLTGAALAFFRVGSHEPYDQASLRIVSPARVEAKSELRGQPRAQLNLGDVLSEDHLVSVRACVRRGDAALDREAIQLRLVRDRSRTDESAEPIWTEPALGDEVPGATTRPECALLQGRGRAKGGRAELTWTPGAFGAAAERVEISTVVRRPLGWPDRAVVGLLLAAILLLFWVGQRTRARTEVAWRAEHALIVMAVFVLASGLGVFGVTRATAFAAGTASMVAYVAACWLQARRVLPRDPLGAMAFHRIPRAYWGASVGIGLLLAVGVSFLLLFVPSGDSPMTEVIQTSGGLVAVITLALVSPWSEELLLRGVLYGALERWGGAAWAVAGSAGIFSLLHLAQHWGNLAPWVMLTLTGLVLSLVRWRTGSTLASTVCHFTYNFCLALPIVFTG